MRQIYVGTVLHGFCNGYFGRDSYETKRVEAIGEDWIVARDDDGHLHFAVVESPVEWEAILQASDDWQRTNESEG